jgi:hypothetical protein
MEVPRLAVGANAVDRHHALRLDGLFGRCCRRRIDSRERLAHGSRIRMRHSHALRGNERHETGSERLDLLHHHVEVAEADVHAADTDGLAVDCDRHAE